MHVFISWSGPRSRHVAQALKEWLPLVINAVRPFHSSSDLGAGVRWNQEIAEYLQKCSVGIVCLTPGNLNEPWILFESGALAKSLSDARLCTLLIDLSHNQIRPPLAQFNHSALDREGIRKIVETINKQLGEEKLQSDQLNTAFEALWPNFEEKIKNMPQEEVPDQPKEISIKEMCQEILLRIREQERALRDHLRRERIDSRIRIEREADGIGRMIIPRGHAGAKVRPVTPNKTRLSDITDVLEILRKISPNLHIEDIEETAGHYQLAGILDGERIVLDIPSDIPAPFADEIVSSIINAQLAKHSTSRGGEG